ncbi:uncharacterized protein LOC101889598 [Musca domestica]|uniref:Uncharacterized protein LOC101889598 n=1 Tax=Musca domestica TaxID=7370 RepID=A0A1I8NC67_MUSDO|nr:uncharacterized protein LOC101889598 [Musca domestica]
MDNIDVNYGPLHTNRHQVLAKYSTALRQLRAFAEKHYEVRPFVFDNFVLFQYFQQSSSDSNNESSGGSGSEERASRVGIMGFSPMNYLKMELLNHILDRKRQILYYIFFLILALLCFFVYRHEVASSERNMQSSIVYPGMRIWRRMTLPLIQRFPRLTELYDESCLMGNPFFQVMDDLSCSTCAHVDGVIDLTNTMDSMGISDEKDGSNESEGGADASALNKLLYSEYVPFVFKINQEPIELEDFHKIFVDNQEIFRRDAYRVQSTNRDINNLDELFSQFNQTVKQQAHNLWRCNRMIPARLLRQLIPRPAKLPSSLALERFMAIDTIQAPSYTLPDTECPHVYIQQALGTRFIILRPTSECRHRCRTLSMRLPQSFVLSYNRYWKPISAPDPVSDTMSISLIGSYC